MQNGTTLVDLSYDYARNNSVGTQNSKTGHLTKITDNLNSSKNREYEFDVLGRGWPEGVNGAMNLGYSGASNTGFTCRYDVN